MRSAVVRSSILADFKRLALALDLDPVALVERVGIDRRHLDDPDVPVPVRAAVELLEIAALTAGIDDFGLRLGESRGLPDLGPVILMLREKASVRDALQTLVSLLHLHSQATYMHLEEGERASLTVDMLVDAAGGCRQMADMNVAGLVQIVRWLLGEDWAPVAACFTHSRPAARVRYERFFHCPLHFLHEFNGIVLRRSDLDRKLPPSSPALRRQVERYIRTIDVAPSDTYAYRVTQVLAMALPRGEARAEVIASYLGAGARTLNRRLARAGLNYSGVLENVRRNLAAQYLLGSDRQLSDISGLVGFGSLSAFTRWFRQSFKSAPSTWRRSRQRRQRRSRRTQV